MSHCSITWLLDGSGCDLLHEAPLSHCHIALLGGVGIPTLRFVDCDAGLCAWPLNCETAEGFHHRITERPLHSPVADDSGEAYGFDDHASSCRWKLTSFFPIRPGAGKRTQSHSQSAGDWRASYELQLGGDGSLEAEVGGHDRSNSEHALEAARRRNGGATSKWRRRYQKNLVHEAEASWVSSCRSKTAS